MLFFDFRFLIGLLKILLISLLVGAGLSFFNISAEGLLSKAGITHENWVALLELLEDWTFSWIIPNIILGSLIVLPGWLLLSLLRPPRQRK